ncbi:MULTISPECIES: alpha/beta hydrolase [unclassified Meiothermus]|uniref:alpha/beta hydrolase n=1 Tax=unclassified Meiothermus TaxID=370471 RepID=UPI001EEBBD24|nr:MULTISPECIES: alpha/beta hydrolase-fold protein [unclassified Meiothermus]
MRPTELYADIWRPYPVGPDHTVVGRVLVAKDFYSPELDNHRDLLVYLPPSYGSDGRRYPVLYMHDGQNLFDNYTSYVGEWRVDETMEGLAKEGLEALVVGIPNARAERLREYSPFPDPEHGGGKGEAYLAFIVETIKPRIDRDFRTLPTREHTYVMGSSLGGLISLYALFRYPEVFGAAGVVSPAFWFANRAIFDYVEGHARVPGRVYMDVGFKEVTRSEVSSRRYLAEVRRMHRLLQHKGLRPGPDYLYVEDRQGQHNESDWARRLPGALRFLLGRSVGASVLFDVAQ